MAQRAVQDRGVSIRMACEAFGVSQTCYRYVAKKDPRTRRSPNGYYMRPVAVHQNRIDVRYEMGQRQLSDPLALPNYYLTLAGVQGFH